jgi:site-specific DNA-adenine methylase
MTFTKQRLPPLLRWAGSKRRLLPELIAQIPEKFSRYIEPFSGSACLFFALRPPATILGDLNCELIDAYKTLRAHPFLTWRELTGMPICASAEPILPCNLIFTLQTNITFVALKARAPNERAGH